MIMRSLLNLLSLRLTINESGSGGAGALNDRSANQRLNSEDLVALCISDGYNPTIGIMHEGSDGSSKLEMARIVEAKVSA
jgi:hypothetical protein